MGEKMDRVLLKRFSTSTGYNVPVRLNLVFYRQGPCGAYCQCRMPLDMKNNSGFQFNPLRPRETGRHYAVSSAFSWMKLFEFRLKFHWNLFLRVQLTIFQVLVQIMAWRRPTDKPLSEPMMVSLLTHICVTRPQWDKTRRHCLHWSYKYCDSFIYSVSQLDFIQF